MAQIPAPSTQRHMKITKSSHKGSPITPNMRGSLLFKHNKKGAPTNSSKFRALAIKSESGVINKIEKLPNMDITPYTDKIIAEHIWVGGSGIDVRSKSKQYESLWNIPLSFLSGTMIELALDKHQVKTVNPQTIFKDPFHGGNNFLVICDSYTPAGEPIPTNKRHRAAQIFNNP